MIHAPGQQFAYNLLDQDGNAVEMVFEALHDHPWIKATTSLHNGFGMVTNQATATRLQVSFRSPESQEPVKLPYFAISFAQLVDTNWNSHKYLKILGNWTDAILAQDTAVVVNHQDDTGGNWISFHASKTNPHSLTPTSPSVFTLDQFKEAATLRFVDLESFQIQIDVGAQEMHGFLFSTEALFCARVEHTDSPDLKYVTNPRIFDLAEEDSENKYIIRAENSSLFQQWYVDLGDYVHAGDALLQVTTMKGAHDVTSNVSGTVSHLQGLLQGDFVENGAPLIVVEASGTNWLLIIGAIVVALAVIGVIIWKCCKKSSKPEPDPDPEKPESVPFTVLEFETPGGWKQTLEWKYQPLGLGFYEQSSPPKVAYVGRDANHTGLKKGDALVAIGDLHSDCELSCLVLRFERSGGSQSLDVEWRTKPLGLAFSDSMPMTVTEVHQEAEHLGVSVGDVLSGYGADGNLERSGGRNIAVDRAATA
eukprot:Skav217917  [mRNA]  locus=scaffold795:287664:290264:- [translate_table: standard]